MESVVMKQLCLVAIAWWLCINCAAGHMLTQHSKLPLQTNKAGSIRDMGCPNNTKVCQDGFEQLGYQKCYLFSCLTDTWDGALAACQSMNATLAYPLNAVEDTALSNYLRSRFGGKLNWWLGGTDAANEGQWVWAHDNSPIVYTDWSPGEPNNLTGENFLMYWEGYNWKWADHGRTHLLNFICQQL